MLMNKSIRKVFRPTLTLLFALLLGFGIRPVHGMHIMEGFLPVGWALFWFAAIAPFWVFGFIKIRRLVAERSENRVFLGLSGAFSFVLSALKLPSVTGSCSHPTGTALGALLFGPFPMAIIGTIVLLFQALLLAHGGLTTLGANAFSMAVVGPFVAYFIWKTLRGKLPVGWVVFLAAALGDLFSYVMTSFQLALAHPDASGGFIASLVKFGGIFAVTQIPLAISEGILTVLIWNALHQTAPDDLRAILGEGAQL